MVNRCGRLTGIVYHEDRLPANGKGGLFVGNAEQRLIKDIVNEVAATAASIASPTRQAFADLARVATKCAELMRDLAPVLETLNLPDLGALIRLAEPFQPGRFQGDVLILRSNDDPEAVQAALDRLLERYFQRGAVFHTRRWALLEPAFQQYRAEAGPEGVSLSFASAWRMAASPALYMAGREIPDNLNLDYAYRWLRRQVRARIEQALLDGATLDEYRGRQEAPLPDEDTPEALKLEAEMAAQLGAAAGLTMEQLRLLQELAPILGKLTPLEREALQSDATDDATRQRRSRAKRKVCDLLQTTAMP